MSDPLFVWIGVTMVGALRTSAAYHMSVMIICVTLFELQGMDCYCNAEWSHVILTLAKDMALRLFSFRNAACGFERDGTDFMVIFTQRS